MLENVSIRDLAAAVERGEPVVDVRTPEEYATGHVPSAVLLPMHLVPLRLDDFRTDTPAYVVCEVGSRSWQVGMFLAEHGIPSRNVIGGTAEWRSAGLPLDTGLPPGIGASTG